MKIITGIKIHFPLKRISHIFIKDDFPVDM